MDRAFGEAGAGRVALGYEPAGPHGGTGPGGFQPQDSHLVLSWPARRPGVARRRRQALNICSLLPCLACAESYAQQAGCCVPLPAPAWLLNRSICAPGRLLCSLACPGLWGARCLQLCGCLAEREIFRLSRAWWRRPTLASILPCLQWLQAYKFREFLPVRLRTSVL